MPACNKLIAYLEAQIEPLRRQVRNIIAVDEKLQHIFDRLASVTGIAAASAIQLLGELLVLPDDMSAKQWVAMAGLDPRTHQSGSSVNKKPRRSKAGNRYLRIALFMPALSAARPGLIENRGLKKLQARCAVMHKPLHAIHAMLKNRTPFDSRRFYIPTETTTDWSSLYLRGKFLGSRRQIGLALEQSIYGICLADLAWAMDEPANLSCLRAERSDKVMFS